MPSLLFHLELATRALRDGAHPERASRDAEMLLLHLLGKDRAWRMTHGDVLLPNAFARSYSELLERRYQGEPIQYIIGETEFSGLPFRVTPDVLIPRPETEHLVEKVLEFAANFPAPRIVDVGTGSGCIAIALAHKFPHAAITAIDLSRSALAVARENAKRNGVDLRFLEGDLLMPVAEEQFEIVVSNPPYVPSADRDTLSVEVRDYEPAQALFAGADGLAIYRRLIPAALAALVSGGFVVLEIGYGQQEPVGALLTGAGFNHVAFTADLHGIARVATARKP